MVEPFAVGLSLAVIFLYLLVLDKLTLYCINEKHFSGVETLFLNDSLNGDIKCADLGGEDKVLAAISVIGDIVTGGTETVSVEDSTEEIAVGEDNGGRAVPRLHHCCIILIECSLFTAHSGLMLPGFRDKSDDSKGKINSCHCHKFEGVVKTGGVGACYIEDRNDIFHSVADKVALQNGLTAEHLVHISRNGVYLAVMNHHTVWVRTLPTGVCVGAETGMNDSHSGMIILAVKVLVELSELVNEEHSLIYYSTAGAGAYVCLFISLFKNHSCNVKLSVERETLFAVSRLFDECLIDIGHTFKSL